MARTDPSVRSMTWPTPVGGALLMAVHDPAVNGAWAFAMPIAACSASKTIASVRNTFMSLVLVSVSSMVGDLIEVWTSTDSRSWGGPQAVGFRNPQVRPDYTPE